MLCHLFHNVNYSDVDWLIDNALIEVPNRILDRLELFEKFAACVEDLIAKDIFLAIYPEVGETFLSWI